MGQQTCSFQTIRIEKMGERGQGIGHMEGGKVVLIPFSAPGDLVRAEIVHETRSFARGRIDELVEPSPDRVEAPCPYYTRCGGCSLQHLPYDLQLSHKHTLLQGVYRALDVQVDPVIPSPATWGYRNRLRMRAGVVNGRLAAGFYQAQSHDLVVVRECLLQTPAVNALARDAVEVSSRGEPDGYPHGINIRVAASSGDMQLTLVGRRGPRDEGATWDELSARHPRLRGLYHLDTPETTEDPAGGSHGYPGNLRRIRGDVLVETLAGASLETEPNTFFQVNPAQAENLVRCMEQVLGAGSRGLLVDLYAGVGALSVPLASRFRAVVAIESVRSACRLATRNAGRNGLPDYRVVCGDAGGMLARVLRERSGGAAGTDVLIADPPRSGMPPSVTRQVARSGIPLVLYLSCDPRTQARDLVHLGDTYRLRRIVPFDMFPHTFHVECLAVLERLPR